MCGIMGYLGTKPVAKVIIEGLKKHEYRGYDSAGLTVLDNGNFKKARAVGRVANLEELVSRGDFTGTVGIGHTRWATHGGVTVENAHPHESTNGRVILVHNGIIENSRAIKEELMRQGVEFFTDTDTESAAQYLGYIYDGDPKAAIEKLVSRIRGAFALVIMFRDRPDEIWTVRKGSPLVLAHGSNETACASDPVALLSFSKAMYFMEDDEFACLKRSGITFYTFAGREVHHRPTYLDWDSSVADRGAFPHFMLKEIHEQPEVVIKTIGQRIKDGKIDLSGEIPWTAEQVKGFKKVHFVACGTSYYATISTSLLWESIGKFDIRSEVASEYRYRDIPIDKNTLAIFVSQSGETADTLHAARKAKEAGATCLLITNVKGSTIDRELGLSLITQAGPEVAVAATKTFTAQLMILNLLGLYLAKLSGTLSLEQEKLFADELLQIAAKISVILSREKEVERIATTFAEKKGFLFIGRGFAFPSTLEGALKLKEISYMHAESYPAGEMKHGPIALLDDNLPIVAMVPRDKMWEKTVSNIEESLARRSPVIAVASEGDISITNYTKNVIYLPEVLPELYTLIAVVPLQLFAYYVARFRGCDIDKPRNLAKSVTVE